MQVTNGQDRSSESLIAVVVLVDPAEQQTVVLWQPVPVVYWGNVKINWPGWGYYLIFIAMYDSKLW